MSDRSLTRLCALADIADSGSAEFDIELGGVRRYLLAVRQGDSVYAYLDFCPHMGYPQNFVNMRFLMTYSKKIHCSVHGASFRPDDGACIGGPPSGDYLGRFETKVENDEVYVGDRLEWPGREKAMAKREAMAAVYRSRAHADE